MVPGPDADALRASLLRWYDAHARDLPWRRTKDPYAIWVSEVMLQQTRVDVALPYFERWMTRFPTVHALAKAPVEDVLRAWAGLGYYSRARNLHAASQAVVTRHDGKVPAEISALRELPGVGPYTAAAIASIAHGRPAAVVDGNVERVVSRLAWLTADPKSASGARAVRAMAQAWLEPARAGDWNQAVMDPGATVCTPVNPRCDACPLASQCAAFATGDAQRLPRTRKAGKPIVLRPTFAVVRKGRSVLLVRNPASGLLAGLWGLPGGTGSTPLVDVVAAQTGVRIQAEGRPARARHEFSHRTWEMRVQPAAVAARKGRGEREARWVAIDQLHAEALPAATRVALRAVGIGAAAPAPAKAKRRPASAGAR